MKRATESLNSNEDEQRKLFKRFFFASFYQGTERTAGRCPAGKLIFSSSLNCWMEEKQPKIYRIRHSFPESGKENDLRIKQDGLQ